MIIEVALVIAPAFLLGPSEGGTAKLILNVSFPSTMLSFTTGIFTATILLPAVIEAVLCVESKSVLFPNKILLQLIMLQKFRTMVN